MAQIDSNTWYFVSEGRVASTNETFVNCLQSRPEGLRVFELVGQAWQFQPVDGIVGRYSLRTNTSGPTQQLSACLDREEEDASKTIACLARSSGDDGQKWDIQDWGDGTLKVRNSANGTGYVLDVHRGAGLFMSSQIESDDVEVRFPAQHWILQSDRPVSDGAYSTTFTNLPAGPATTSSSTSASRTDAGTTTGSSTSTSRPSSSGSSGGLSPGAAAGIGVGVSLLVVGIVAGAIFMWWRRRKQTKQPGTIDPTTPSTMQQSLAPYSPNPPEMKPYGVGHYGQYDQQPPVAAYAPPQIHEAPAEEHHYELDSGQTRTPDGTNPRL